MECRLNLLSILWYFIVISGVGGQKTTNFAPDDVEGWSPRPDDVRALMRRVAELEGRVGVLEARLSECRQGYREIRYTNHNGDDNTHDAVHIYKETSSAQPDMTTGNATSEPDVTSSSVTSGNTYVRWGRTDCPYNTTGNTSLIYTGYAAGGHYQHKGSGGNFLCLTSDPTFDPEGYPDPGDWYGYIHGAEYETWPPYRNSKTAVGNHDMPCAVCLSQTTTILMVPGTTSCPVGWYPEYTGFLASSYHDYYRTEYICVDRDAQTLRGGAQNTNGALIYAVRARCGALLCPPYIDRREVTCVVCSR